MDTPNSAADLLTIVATGTGQDVVDALEAMTAKHGEFLTRLMMETVLNAVRDEAGAPWVWEYSTLDGATVYDTTVFWDLPALKKAVDNSFADYTWEEVERRDLRTRIMTVLHNTLRDIDTARGAPAGRTGHEIAHFNSERLADAVLAEIDDEAIDRMAKHYIDETHIKALEIRNGANLELQPAQDMVALWVAAARTMLGDAENYSETPVGLPSSVSMDVKLAGEFEMFTLTVQRAGKLTPHQARIKAERERDDARNVALLCRDVLQQMPTFLDELLGVDLEELPDWFTDEDNEREFWGGGDV
jgi:hypothetical protein